MRRLGVVILGMAFSALASMQSSYEEGRSFAESEQKQVQKVLSEAKPTQVPGFKTETPPETNLDKGGNFEEATRSSLTRNEAGKQVIESAGIRPRIVIDPKTHPLFQTADAQAPEAMLNIPSEAEAAQAEGPLEKICEEGGEAIRYECIENRYVMPQVPLKTSILWVDHVVFTPHMESYSIPGKKRKWYRHSKAATTGTRQNGYILKLPKDIKAFKEAFCPTFTGIDAKTQARLNVDCSHIEGYQLNPESNVSISQDSVSIHVSEAKVNISLFHRTYEGEEIDEWRSNCGPFEDMVEQGLCHYGERTLSEGASTKNIEGYAITKDAWQYSQIYDCQMIKDECSPLRAQRCYQTGSRCKEQRQGKCWIFEQRYQCPSGKLSAAQSKSPPLGAFCLTGDCHDHSYQANNELLEVMARLNVLKEVEDDIHDKKGHFEIFKGQHKQCSRNCLNFKDCCKKLKGWGISLGLAGCKPEENILSEMRAKNLCHPTGTFCSKKGLLGKCSTKTSTFCCFGTRLARLVHEQGRPQIGMDWGSARHPHCQGLSVEQFSGIDLSNINFSEIFEDVMQKYHKTDTQALQQKTQEQMRNNLSTIEQGLKDKTVGSQSGKLNADQKDF